MAMKNTKRRLELLKQPSSKLDQSSQIADDDDDDNEPMIFKEPVNEDAFLERQKQFKSMAGENGEDDSLGFHPFVGLSMGDFGNQQSGSLETLDRVTDRKKKNEIFNQIPDAEKERFERLDRVRIPEKKIKQIVSKVHINKTLLKIISGVAKVWVGEIIEDAKVCQTKESYKLKKAISKDEENKQENEEEMRETLFYETALTPYYLKQARDEYERKRSKSQIKIFDSYF